jgi:hypothetical protein
VKRFVSNLNTISAIFDRLAVENVKLVNFQHKQDHQKIEAQMETIKVLKEELVNTFETLSLGDYVPLKEERTYRV